MKLYTQSLTIMGTVEKVDGASFTVSCQNGMTFNTFVGSETVFRVLTNLDSLNNDRVPTPPNYKDTLAERVKKYLKQGDLITVQGVQIQNGGGSRFDARTVHLVSSANSKYLFEETHWWLTQTSRLADQWLDSLFGSKRDYALSDFVQLYRTTLNISGLQVDDETQECAVLSRLIYGFSAAYLLTGQDRYLHAAAAGVKFQRDAFRSLSHDGRYCFWAYGRRQTKYGTQLLVPSASGDDTGSIALYEQIYALAGMTLYYRISLDRDTLKDIQRTLRTFRDFYLDDESRAKDPGFTGADGWFSHVDYATLRPDLNSNPANNQKKNWNSIGDHIPAYLINLILAIDPLPANDQKEFQDLLDECRDILERSTRLILEKFPDKDANIPYVNERFNANWSEDHEYSWQKNRAVIGHNYKIAWNLCRVYSYYMHLAVTLGSKGVKYDKLAFNCLLLAEQLGKAMTDVGFDQLRGGCFDALERRPSNGQPIEFTWMNTKDFWQQEQAILAYLILYGQTGDPLYIEMARRAESFWNVFFLDRDNRGMYFRVTDNGVPIIDSSYGVRGGHSDASGYHCFELNYLAHIYNRCYVSPDNATDTVFCLYFKPCVESRMESINVLPDFIPDGCVTINNVWIGGTKRSGFNPNSFQVALDKDDLGQEIIVEFGVRGQQQQKQSGGKKSV